MKRGIVTIENGIVSISGSATEVWMTKHEIARLLGCFVAKVVSNIPSILKAGVLDERAVCRRIRYDDGSGVELYGLEMIVALAFRIKSRNADLLRRWIMTRVVTGRAPAKRVSMLVRYNDKALPD